MRFETEVNQKEVRDSLIQHQQKNPGSLKLLSMMTGISEKKLETFMNAGEIDDASLIVLESLFRA